MDAMAGEPSLVLWDLVIDSASRRKGLGRHLLVLLELIARRTRMRFLSLPVMNGDDAARDWVTRGGKGFAVDTSLEALVGFDAQEEGFQVRACVRACTCGCFGCGWMMDDGWKGD